MSDILNRKHDHLDLAARGDVGFHTKTALFDDVILVHDALPEIEFEDVDASVPVLDKRLRSPILIAGMTGGTERARTLNRELAAIAEEDGYAFGFGSMRPMLSSPEARASYEVRDVAPTALLLGNLGAVQAAGMSSAQIADLIGGTGIDALCIHLNPAMELVQPEGDRDFRGCLAKLEELAHELTIPIVAKETGCGISSAVARRLRRAGIRHVDVSGSGGTSWVAVEYHRAPEELKGLGETFREWGIPTAASVAMCVREGFETVFATGGVRNGLDIARAVVLGATAGGIARPVLQAFEAGGRAGARAFLNRVAQEVRVAMLLVGVSSIPELREVPRMLKGDLADWMSLVG